MSRKRWIPDGGGTALQPAIFHVVSRVVDRRFVFKDVEREKFRTFMRMQASFSGCKILAYCLMSNHQSEAVVAGVAKELADARLAGNDGRVAEIHARYTYRMHNLSEFMKTLLQRFTRWFNRTHERSGTLWEERFKSVIVESGIATRTIAAYIDLNPVRAGMIADPAEYRWSSYGEAVGGGTKGNGKKAREGLVRACMSHHGVGFEADRWKEVSRIYRRAMGLALGRKSGRAEVNKTKVNPMHNTAEALAAKENGTVLPELGMAKMLRCRVRYFTDGAVIGSKEFVNEAFAGARERFTEKRKDGARKLRGNGSAAAGVLWSVRDLRLRV